MLMNWVKSIADELKYRLSGCEKLEVIIGTTSTFCPEECLTNINLLTIIEDMMASMTAPPISA